jgi:archaellum component FlaF (FlaF/FlaG flagellin family)
MKLKTGISLFLAGATLSLAIVSCKKTNTNPSTPADTDTSVAADNGLAEGIYNDVQNISDQASDGDLKFYSPQFNGNLQEIQTFEKSSCATITHDSLSTPRTLVIDFGSANCLCQDGNNRRGKINISYIGKYRESGSVHTISFTNYFVNDNQVIGTKTVTNNGKNTNGNTSFSIVIDGQIIKANNAGTLTWKSNRTREWLVGEDTKTWIDDVYSITGSSSGTNSNGNAFTASITTPLHRALNCHWFDAGVIEVNQTGKVLKTINFGSGTCDSDATVTILGKTYPITLK